MQAALQLQNLNPDDFLHDPARRQQYITPLFETIAPSYDRFTRWGTFGFDMTWKRSLLRLVRPRLTPDATIIDLATGTGDLVFAIAPRVPRGRVIGTDIATAMIQRAEARRIRSKRANVEFRLADNMALPFSDHSIDLVTASYALRNCQDFRGVLAEVFRVLRPGGWFASLELVRPEHPLWRGFFMKGLALGCNFHGWLWHRQPKAYGYLAESIAHFVTGPELVDAAREAGFGPVENHSSLFGAVSILLAHKPAHPQKRGTHVV